MRWNNRLVPDEQVTSGDDASDESGQLPTSPEASAEEVQTSNECSASPQVLPPAQTYRPDDPEEAEPAGEPSASKGSSASAPGERDDRGMHHAEFSADQMRTLQRSGDPQSNKGNASS